MIDTGAKQIRRTRGIAGTTAFVRGMRRELNAARTPMGYADATTNGPDYGNHFAGAVPGSANLLLNRSERSLVRQRVRRELLNSSYLRGLIDTHVYSVIGRVPRVRISAEHAEMTEKHAKEAQDFVTQWMKKIMFGDISRQMLESRKIDGEDTSIIRTKSNLWFPVKMAIRRLDCDQLTSNPYNMDTEDEEKEVDGIILEDGDPVAYRFLRRHPQSLSHQFDPTDFMEIPEQYVLHYFRELRVGQRRGMSEVAPCLLPSAAMRRYTMAVVKNAEVAANLTGVMYTDEINDDDSPMAVPYESVGIEQNMLMALPDGYKMAQMKAEQPMAIYPEFKRELIGESARGIGVSTNSAMGDSSDSSYSSAKFDRILEFLVVSIERHDFSENVIDRVLFHLAMEASICDSLSVTCRKHFAKWVFDYGSFPPYEVLYDQLGSMDEEKRSKSYDIDIKNGSRTISHILGERDGRTIEEHLADMKRELALYQEAGVPLPAYLVDMQAHQMELVETQAEATAEAAAARSESEPEAEEVESDEE